MNEEALNAMEEALEAFLDGEPTDEEWEVTEGVTVHCDWPFEEDLVEPHLTVAFLVDPEVHGSGIAEYEELWDSPLEDVVYEVNRTFDRAGFDGEWDLEEVRLSENNSSENLYVYLSSVDNPNGTWE